MEYAKDGHRFASAGADGAVMIWNAQYNSILKYSHKNASIQALAYNPVTHQLVSCTERDFGMWAPENRTVRKKPVPSKILCAAWSRDGQALALGMLSGAVSVRDAEGVEQYIITRGGPVWSLDFSTAWSAAAKQEEDVLAIGSWDQTLSFYTGAEQRGKDVQLGYDPTTVSWFSNGTYLLVGGSNKKAVLYKRDGVELCDAAPADDWIWAAKQRPGQNFFAMAHNDGRISVHAMTFATVHGLYKDRYAYRDEMTDVIVQHLLTEQKVRIKCKDYVQKIAVYKNRLAVQLKKRVLVYELGEGDDGYDMQYRIKKRINNALECNMLVVTSEHVILCQETRLQLYSLDGTKEREWVLESVIRYIKLVGGPDGGEGLLVALKNGSVYKIYVDNPFPGLVLRHTSAVRSVDLSLNRQRLAMVDEHYGLHVVDLDTKDTVYQADNVVTVAWNSQAEDVLAYSGTNELHIKTGSFPVASQRLQGVVVGFHGSKVFSLQRTVIQTVDIPQSASMHRFIDTRKLQAAYEVACLGVTDGDWRFFGVACLRAEKFDLARKAFARIKDMRYMELLTQLEAVKGSRGGRDEEGMLLADISAFQGRFEEAAQLYKKAGAFDAAIDMFTDLRRWEAAKSLAESSGGAVDVQQLMARQAQVAEDMGDYQAAATLHASLGNHERAINLLGENADLQALAAVVNTLDASKRSALEAAAKHFRAAGREGARYAKDTYIKMDDIASLLGVHIECEEWQEAISLAAATDAKAAKAAAAAGLPVPEAEHTVKVFLPYAEWLVNRGEYVQAREALSKAARPDLAATILVALSLNAAEESRHKDAAVLYLQLAKEELHVAAMPSAAEAVPLDCKRSLALAHLSRVHYAYDFVLQFVDAPFTPLIADTIFQASAYVLNGLTAASSPSIAHNKLEYLDGTVFFPSTLPAPADGGGSALDVPQSRAGAAWRSRSPLIRGDGVPMGLSVAKVLYALAQQASQLGAFRLAKSSYERLAALHYPRQWRDPIEVARMALQAKPYSDRDEVLPVCYRCSSVNPVLRVGGSGDVCTNCGHPFARCFLTFDVLPLVQFAPNYDSGVTDEQALSWLRSDSAKSSSGGSTAAQGGVESLSFGAPERLAGAGGETLAEALASSDVMDYGRILEATPAMMKGVKRSRVISAPWHELHPDLHPRYYFNAMPDVHVAVCKSCCSMFNAQELEQSLINTKDKCPVCNEPAECIAWGNV